MQDRIYKMTKTHLDRRIGLLLSINCQTCRGKINIGDSVYSKPSSHMKGKIRHEECAKRIGLI